MPGLRHERKQHLSHLRFEIRVLVTVLVAVQSGKMSLLRHQWRLAALPCLCLPCHPLASPAALSSSSLSWPTSSECPLPDKSVAIMIPWPNLSWTFRSSFCVLLQIPEREYLIRPARCLNMSTEHCKSITWWAVNPASHMDKGNSLSWFLFQCQVPGWIFWLHVSELRGSII